MCITVSELSRRFRTLKNCAEYLGMSYQQLREATKKNAIVVDRTVYVPSSAKVRPVEKRTVNEFDIDDDLEF